MSVIDTGGPGGAETVFLQSATRLDPTRFRSIPVISREGWLSERVRARGVEPMIVSASGSFHVGYLRTLLRIARQHNVDVVAGHLYGSAVYSSLAGLLSGIPVVSILHGQSDVQRRERFASAKSAIVRRGSRKVVFVSDNLRTELAARLRLPHSQCAVIPNGVDTSLFRPGRDRSLRQDLGIPDDTILIGAIGNIRKPKAYEILLQAAERLTRGTDRYHFAIAGDASGALGAELLQLRDQLGLTRRVSFLGLREDIATVLHNLDLFVLSSRTEGFSIACIEAMACGVPVVATRSGGPQQILDEDCGILVPVDNPAELADAIERATQTPGLAGALAGAALSRVRERFSLQTMLSRYESLLSEAAVGAN